MSFQVDVTNAVRLDDSKSISDLITFCDYEDEGLNLKMATISYSKPFSCSILQPNLQIGGRKTRLWQLGGHTSTSKASVEVIGMTHSAWCIGIYIVLPDAHA